MRHCNYVASFDAIEDGNDDFHFTLVAALNGAPLPAVSLRSVNFDTQYVVPIKGTDIGILESPNVDDASWSVVPALSGNVNASSLKSLSKAPASAGLYLSWSTAHNAPCGGDGDATLTTGTDAARSSFFIGSPPPPPPAPPATVHVNVGTVTHVVNPLFMGCHIDPGYTQQPRGWYSQLIYGESFEAGTTKVFAWNDITTSGVGSAALDKTVTGFNPNLATPALKVTFTSGTGVAGWSNRGIGNEGMSLLGGKPYEGFTWVLAPTGGALYVAVNNHVTGQVLDSKSIPLNASSTWQRVDFVLTPSADTSCVTIARGSDPTVDCGNFGANPGHACVKCGGELQLGLASPGTVWIAWSYFSPGPWGRLGELPVLKGAADLMTQMGMKIIRQGGTVSQSFTWKEWRGAPWARASSQHVWGQSLVGGWGPFEFVDACAELGIVPVLTLAYDRQNATDWADLVEYLFGSENTVWGKTRIVTDGHPAVYNVTTWELGNEQENPDFVAQVIAMEAKRKEIGAPVIHYMYPTNDGVSAATASALVAAGVDPAVIAPDCHVGGGGGIACAVKDFGANTGFHQSFINCETNAAISTMKRAIQESSDLQEWFNFGSGPGEDPSRLLGRTASFCTER